MSISPPRVPPQNWAVGVNLAPEEDDGGLMVRMTFGDTPKHRQAVKDWMDWLMKLDPVWGGAP